MILLDTNVLSEVLRPVPALQVAGWLNAREGECVLSSITIFELMAGVALLEPGRRRSTLGNAIARTIRRFAGRIYAFDSAAAEAAAGLLAQARSQGLGLHQIPAKLADLQIAGIATAYALTLATRNGGDFSGLGLRLVNPWDE